MNLSLQKNVDILLGIEKDKVKKVTEVLWEKALKMSQLWETY